MALPAPADPVLKERTPLATQLDAAPVGLSLIRAALEPVEGLPAKVALPALADPVLNQRAPLATQRDAAPVIPVSYTHLTLPTKRIV